MGVLLFVEDVTPRPLAQASRLKQQDVQNRGNPVLKLGDVDLDCISTSLRLNLGNDSS